MILILYYCIIFTWTKNRNILYIDLNFRFFYLLVLHGSSSQLRWPYSITNNVCLMDYLSLFADVKGQYHKVVVKEMQTTMGNKVKVFNCMSCNIFVSSLSDFKGHPCKACKWHWYYQWNKVFIITFSINLLSYFLFFSEVCLSTLYCCIWQFKITLGTHESA